MPSPRLFRGIMPAADIDAAAQFYSALLDSPGMRISGGRHYFDCGGVILAVYSTAGDGGQTMGQIARRPGASGRSTCAIR